MFLYCLTVCSKTKRERIAQSVTLSSTNIYAIVNKSNCARCEHTQCNYVCEKIELAANTFPSKYRLELFSIVLWLWSWHNLHLKMNTNLGSSLFFYFTSNGMCVIGIRYRMLQVQHIPLICQENIVSRSVAYFLLAKVGLIYLLLLSNLLAWRSNFFSFVLVSHHLYVLMERSESQC